MYYAPPIFQMYSILGLDINEITNIGLFKGYNDLLKQEKCLKYVDIMAKINEHLQYLLFYEYSNCNLHKNGHSRSIYITIIKHKMKYFLQIINFYVTIIF